MKKMNLSPESQISRKNSFKLNSKYPLRVGSNERSQQESSYYTSRQMSKKNSFQALEEKMINLEHRMKNLHSHHTIKNHPQSFYQTKTIKEDNQLTPRVDSSKLIAFISSEKKRTNSKDNNLKYDNLIQSSSSKDFRCSPKKIDFKVEIDNLINGSEETFVQKLQKKLISQKQEQYYQEKNAQINNLLNRQNVSMKISQKVKSPENFDEIKGKIQQFKDIKLSNEKEVAFYSSLMKSYCSQNTEYCFDFFSCNDIIVLKYLNYLLYSQLEQIKSQNISQLKISKESYEQKIESYEKEISKLKLELQEVESTSCSFHQIKKIIDETSFILVEVIESMKKIYGSQSAGSQQKISILQVQNLNDQIQKLKGSFKDQKLGVENRYQKESHQVFSQLVTECQSIDSPKYQLSGDRFPKQTDYSQKQQCESVKQMLNSQRNQLLIKIENSEKNLLDGQFKNISNQPNYQLQKQQLVQLNKKPKRTDEEEKGKLIEGLKMENEDLKILLENQQKELIRVNEKTTQINETFEKLMKHNKMLEQENDEHQNTTELLRKEILQVQLLLEKEKQLHADTQDEIYKLQEQLKSTKISNIDIQNSFMSNQNQDRQQYDLLMKKNSGTDNHLLMGELSKLNNKIKDQQNLFNYIISEAQQLGQIGLLVLDMCLSQEKDSLPKTLAILQNEFQLKRQQIQMKLQSLEIYESNCRLQIKESKSQDFHNVIDQIQHQKSCVSKSFTEQLDKSHIKKIGGGITQRDDSCQYLFSAIDQQQIPQNDNQDYFGMILAQCTVIERMMMEQI